MASARGGRPRRWLRLIAAASVRKRLVMRVRRPCRLRAPWRSSVSRSLSVWKIDSIRCRIGARWGLRPGSWLRVEGFGRLMAGHVHLVEGVQDGLPSAAARYGHGYVVKPPSMAMTWPVM